jgi:hypothetical protein
MKKAMGGCSILAAVLCIATTGCVMTGSYNSAKTLEPGTSSFGLTFGINEFRIADKNYSYPSIIPEIAFHTGAAENLEMGGRIALAALGLEGDAKYRFFHTASLHLAVNPAVGYQAFITLKGVTASLPLIATYDLSNRFSLTVAGFGRYSHFNISDTSADNPLPDFFGNKVIYGGSFGPEVHGETFFFRPMVEVAHVVPVGDRNKKEWNRVSVAVHLGWILGREKQQLDRIEKKIDKIDNKLDKPDTQKTDTGK